MAHRIEIGLKSGVRDARGQGVVAKAKDFLHLPLRGCRTRDIYKIDAKISKKDLRGIKEAFADPVISRSAVGRLKPPRFDWMIEVGFKPGVTDNVGRTACVVVKDVLGRDLNEEENVYTSIQYFLTGDAISRDAADHIAGDILANPLIHSIRVFDPSAWDATEVDEEVPAIRDETAADVETYDLSGSDEDLMRISSEGILSLSLREMHAIRDHFRSESTLRTRRELGLPDDPTDVEIEAIAQTWSEHCKHKIFAGRIHYTDEKGHEETIDSLFKTCIKDATEEIAQRVDWLVSVFSDNAGVIKFNDRYHISFKVETHNSPSALEPYGGAITGIVGCNRDPMGTGMGCELLYNTWGYCLGSPFYDGDVPEGLFHPRRIRDGVHQGVIDGGNQSGIPWARGFEFFDDRYIGKPLVYCGTVGRLPVDVGGAPSERKEIEPGDVIVMAGGRIGKDGIHGATFSSEELRKESPAQAVQIGDPITQRILYEFLVEARDLGLYRAITDNGAGGLSSSIGEMATISGGAELDLAKAPLKYQGLQPWEILLSEAQERMSLAVPPEQVDAFLELARRRDVEANAIGTFTNNGTFHLRYGDRTVGCLHMDFLHDGCPTMELTAKWEPPNIAAPAPLKGGPRNKALKALLGSLNVCSREFKSRMYDSEVKGLSIVKPFVGVHADVPSDATVLLADYESNEGVVVAEGINPFYSDIDTYHMMASIIDEGVRRAISVGARLDTMAGLDNFCWPDPVQSEKTPDGHYKMAQLVRANKALYDVTTTYNVPCISGKDSMKNDSVRGGRKISIPPTVLFSTIGKIDDVGTAVTMHFKTPGDVIYIIGPTRNELGASEFHRYLAEEQGDPALTGGDMPKLNMELALSIYRSMNQATAQGLLRSSHTPTLGGLGVGLALCAIGGDLGATVDLKDVPRDGALKDDALLFSESNSRFIVTCTPGNAVALEALFNDVPFARVGEVGEGKKLVVNSVRGSKIVDAEIKALRKAFKETLRGI